VIAECKDAGSEEGRLAISGSMSARRRAGVSEDGGAGSGGLARAGVESEVSAGSGGRGQALMQDGGWESMGREIHVSL